MSSAPTTPHTPSSNLNSSANIKSELEKEKEKQMQEEIDQIIQFLETDPVKAITEKDINGNTLFHFSCCNSQHFRVTQKILELLLPSLDLNLKNSSGRTPLHLACVGDAIMSAKLLIDTGANVNEIDHLSNTPLHVASENGNDKIVSLLITRGAHIDSINSKGDSPLHIATWNGQTPCVSHLLEAGANYELLNQSGKTPLFIAVEERFPDCVELLIAHGANEFCVDSSGVSIEQLIQDSRGCEKESEEIELTFTFDKALNNRNILDEQAGKRGLSLFEYRSFLFVKAGIEQYLLHCRHSYLEELVSSARSQSNWNRLKQLLQLQKTFPPKPSFVLSYERLWEKCQQMKEILAKQFEQLIINGSQAIDSCETLLKDLDCLAKDLVASLDASNFAVVFDGEKSSTDELDLSNAKERRLAQSMKEIKEWLKNACKLAETKAKPYAAKLIEDCPLLAEKGLGGLVMLFKDTGLEAALSFIVDLSERGQIFREVVKRSFRVDHYEIVNVIELSATSTDGELASIAAYDGMFSGEVCILGRTQKVVIKLSNERRDLSTESSIYDLIGKESGHIIQKFAYYDQPPLQYLVLEHFGEDLRYFMEPSSDIKHAILRKVLLAVDYLHEQGICHLDLKPQNILIQSSNRGIQVKICDLESARRVGDAFPYGDSGLRFTKDWVSPEVYHHREVTSGAFKATYEIDMFALGLIIASLLDRRCRPDFVILPSSTPDLLDRALRDQQYLYSLAPCDNHGKTYVEHVKLLLSLDASRRYSIHDFIRRLEENSISNVHKENIVLQRKLQHLKTNVMDKLEQLYIMSQSMEAKMSTGFQILTRTIVNLANRKVPTTFCIVEKRILTASQNYPPRKAIDTMSRVFQLLTKPASVLAETAAELLTDTMCLFLLCECCYQPQMGMEPYPIEIKEPKKFVPYILPLARVGLLAAAAVNHGMKIGRIFGLPTPTLGAQEMDAANTFLDSLQQPETYGELEKKVHNLWERNRREGKTDDIPDTLVDNAGSSEFCLRMFESFVLKHDITPTFCGLSRVQNSTNGEVGYVCRSCLTNPAFQ